MASSSRPTVVTKYPRVQKCCPTKFRFGSPYTRAKLPPLLIVALLLRLEYSFRQTVAYALTFRFVLLTVPITFMALFLGSEHYSFAVLKGIATYGYLVGLALTMPLAHRASTIRRLAGAALSLILARVAWNACVWLPDKCFNGKPDAILGMFDDPIGCEVDEASLKMDYLNGSPLRSSFDALEALDQARKQGASLLVGLAGLKRKVEMFSAWPTRFLALDSAWEQEISRSSHEDSSGRFETTKVLIRLNIEVVRATRKAIRAAVLLRTHPSVENLTEFCRDLNLVATAQIEGEQKWIANRELRSTPVEKRLIAWDAYPAPQRSKSVAALT
jgi:hypothetical protein